MKGIIAFWFLGLVAIFAELGDRKTGRRSLIDSDPAVVYVAELLPDKRTVELQVVGEGVVYATKTGGRKLGVLRGGKVQLIGFDQRACKVQGQGLSGWVKPTILAAPEGNLWEQLQAVYEREMAVRKMIEEGEIALGMSREEICQVLGKPTKQTIKRTKEGVVGRLEFIQYEELKHYEPVVDPHTLAVYRRYTHTTQEEKAKVVVEFENDIASAIEESENEQGGDVRVVVRPVVWWW